MTTVAVRVDDVRAAWGEPAVRSVINDGSALLCAAASDVSCESFRHAPDAVGHDETSEAPSPVLHAVLHGCPRCDRRQWWNTCLAQVSTILACLDRPVRCTFCRYEGSIGKWWRRVVDLRSLEDIR